MEETKEISALFTLIDDPDEEVFGAVSHKIIGYGKNIIPKLMSVVSHRRLRVRKIRSGRFAILTH